MPRGVHLLEEARVHGDAAHAVAHLGGVRELRQRPSNLSNEQKQTSVYFRIPLPDREIISHHVLLNSRIQECAKADEFVEQALLHHGRRPTGHVKAELVAERVVIPAVVGEHLRRIRTL